MIPKFDISIPFRRSSPGAKEPDEDKGEDAPLTGSFFSKAQHFVINGGNFILHNHQSIWVLLLLLIPYTGLDLISSVYHHHKSTRFYASVQQELIDPQALGILYHRVAANAITNAAREDVKCHPGTRENVISDIEKWISPHNGSDRMWWLRGPAGGGKTAIMKTISERSKDRGIPTINFFFYRGDITRNNAKPFVATLLQQILDIERYRPARRAVAGILSARPSILDATIHEQFNGLIFPLFDILRQSTPKGSSIVLLIDGLDECEVGPQEIILRSLANLVSQENSPFLALVASRPEPQIQMVFNQLGISVDPISLDDKLQPNHDIQFFVTAELDKIKASHPLAQYLPKGWPRESDTQWIVTKSSGQFIFAATVMRLLANPRVVPSLSLEEVQGIVSTTKPLFTEEDAVYTLILNNTYDHEATMDILSAKLLNDYVMSIEGCKRERPQLMPSVEKVLQAYNSRYTDARFVSSLSDLNAIAQISGDQLIFHHATFTDFLLDQSRSGIYYVSPEAFAAKVFLAAWSHPVGIEDAQYHLPSTLHSTYSDFLRVPLGVVVIWGLKGTSPAVTEALLTVDLSKRNNIHMSYRAFVHFLRHIHKLYYFHDITSYSLILRRWIDWAVFNGVDGIESIVDYDLLPRSGGSMPYWARYLMLFAIRIKVKALLDLVLWLLF